MLPGYGNLECALSVLAVGVFSWLLLDLAGIKRPWTAEFWTLYVILGIALTLAVTAWDANLAPYGDNADFILAGRRLSETGSMGAERFPVGFPAMIALMDWVVPGVGPAKVMVCLWYLAAVALTYFVVKGE